MFIAQSVHNVVHSTGNLYTMSYSTVCTQCGSQHMQLICTQCHVDSTVCRQHPVHTQCPPSTLLVVVPEKDWGGGCTRTGIVGTSRVQFIRCLVGHGDHRHAQVDTKYVQDKRTKEHHHGKDIPGRDEWQPIPAQTTPVCLRVSIDNEKLFFAFCMFLS